MQLLKNAERVVQGHSLHILPSTTQDPTHRCNGRVGCKICHYGGQEKLQEMAVFFVIEKYCATI